MEINIKDGKVTMDFDTFAELANAKIESNNAKIEANNLKIEVARYKRAIKEILTEIVKNSDAENNSFYKENAMPIPLFPEVSKNFKKSNAKCAFITIRGRSNGE